MLFEWRPHASEGRRFTVAANRDEFFHRPTGRLHVWPRRPEVFAGVDDGAPLSALGLPGTWMGVTRQGRFAAITNVRGPQERSPTALSRGGLTTGFLASTLPPAEYLLDVQSRAQRYNGFNLLVGELRGDDPQLWWYSNRGKHAPRKLTAGVYGLSNASLDTPWPKVVRGVSAFSIALARADANSVPFDALFDLLADTTPASDSDLPSTGVPVEWERVLSPIFIATPTYGTRSSTVVSVLTNGRIDVRERAFFPQGNLSNVEEVALQAHAVI
ncbi:MAG TPA: NRDE family protein [Burkholderiaceae bacterium]|nr:NRDE family protein [Burkholderiaceae bacterium]